MKKRMSYLKIFFVILFALNIYFFKGMVRYNTVPIIGFSILDHNYTNEEMVRYRKFDVGKMTAPVLVSVQKYFHEFRGMENFRILKKTIANRETAHWDCFYPGEGVEISLIMSEIAGAEIIKGISISEGFVNAVNEKMYFGLEGQDEAKAKAILCEFPEKILKETNKRILKILPEDNAYLKSYTFAEMTTLKSHFIAAYCLLQILYTVSNEPEKDAQLLETKEIFDSSWFTIYAPYVLKNIGWVKYVFIFKDKCYFLGCSALLILFFPLVFGRDIQSHIIEGLRNNRLDPDLFSTWRLTVRYWKFLLSSRLPRDVREKIDADCRAIKEERENKRIKKMAKEIWGKIDSLSISEEAKKSLRPDYKIACGYNKKQKDPHRREHSLKILLGQWEKLAAEKQKREEKKRHVTQASKVTRKKAEKEKSQISPAEEAKAFFESRGIEISEETLRGWSRANQENLLVAAFVLKKLHPQGLVELVKKPSLKDDLRSNSSFMADIKLGNSEYILQYLGLNKKTEPAKNEDKKELALPAHLNVVIIGRWAITPKRWRLIKAAEELGVKSVRFIDSEKKEQVLSITRSTDPNLLIIYLSRANPHGIDLLIGISGKARINVYSLNSKRFKIEAVNQYQKL